MDLTGALYWLVYGLFIVGACTDVLWLKIPNVLVGLVVLAFGASRSPALPTYRRW